MTINNVTNNPTADIYQKYNKPDRNAETTYKIKKENDPNPGNWWVEELQYRQALSALDSVNSELSEDYAYIIGEQVQLQTEIDEVENEIEDFETSLQKEMNELESDIEKLGEKAEDGTITDEEQTELDNKQGEYKNLPETVSGSINDKQNNIQNKAKEFKINSKMGEKAIDYATTTMQKGAETLEYYSQNKEALDHYLSSGTSKSGIEHTEGIMARAGVLLAQTAASAILESDINDGLDIEKPETNVEQKEFSFKEENKIDKKTK